MKPWNLEDDPVIKLHPVHDPYCKEETRTAQLRKKAEEYRLKQEKVQKKKERLERCSRRRRR